MTEWRKVGESPRPMMARAAAEVQPLAQVVGDIPDVHVISVRERRVTVDYPTIIQNNVNTDTIELDLDGEWDGMSVVLVLGPCGEATELAWHGEPLTLPSALAEDTGGIDVSVVGYSADGDTRLVTVAAPSLLNVIKSGCTVGEAPGDETPDLIGQLVAAGDAANKAAQSANAAAENANGAAGAANTAASAANTAAGKADTAATKATDAATKANDAAGDATRAAQSANAAAEAAGAAAEAARGNVLKGTIGPAPVLSADDAYATKPRRLTVYGNTRQNLWVNPSGTINGVTLTANDDGSITVGGTSTASVPTYFNVSHRIYALKPETTYTLSVDKAFTGMYASVREDDSSGSAITTHSVQSGVLTFQTKANMASCLFFVSVVAGTTVSGTYRVMLNEGSEAQPWCPPGLNGVDKLSVVTAGKNLASTEFNNTVSAGITFNTEFDGSISAVGTATSTYPQRVNVMNLPSNTDMVASKTVTGGIGQGGYYYFIVYGIRGSEQKLLVSTKNADEAAFNTGEYDYWTFTPVAEGNGVTFDCKLYPQLELGSTATDYEPPAVTTTPVDLDGHTLNSLPDGTRDELVIGADGSCRVERKTKAIELDGSDDERIVLDTTKEKTQVFGISMDDLLIVSADSAICDILPSASGLDIPLIATAGESIYIAVNKTDASTVEEFRAWLAENKPKIVYLVYESTEPLTPVTLPTLPAPNITVYNDSDVPSDMTVEYERDVTIAFDKLQAQVSATTVREATNG